MNHQLGLCREMIASIPAIGVRQTPPPPQAGEGKVVRSVTVRRWALHLAATAGLASAVLAAAGAVTLWIISLGPAPLGEGLEFSTTVVDREGRLLRPYATSDGRWRLPAHRDGVDPRYLELLIAYEDKRFRTHSGVDPLALLRAG